MIEGDDVGLDRGPGKSIFLLQPPRDLSAMAMALPHLGQHGHLLGLKGQSGVIVNLVLHNNRQ